MADIQINVMMFGGRRCGKTSVLAFMQSCFEKVFDETNLTISPENEELTSILKNKRTEINEYFENRNNRITYFTSPDDNPSQGISEYKFKIGLRNKRTDNIIVNFIDYPGEWLTNENTKLTDIMKNSHVIIVAIDSPYLMEEPESYASEDNPGKYNERRNHCKKIGEWVKNHFAGESDLSAKMILFVPLKCEKYYHEGRMNELNKKIKKAYASTLNLFENNNRTYEVAIIPILTFGGENEGVEFRYFDWDEKGKILEDEKNSKLPQKAVYRIPMEMKSPNPLHCEKTMVYVLAYILTMAARQRQQGGILDGARSIFGNFASAEDFLNELNNIKQKMKKPYNGYEIVCNPLDF